MKSLLPTLVVTMLLAHLVTGSWYVRKCANKLGNCRKACRSGELPTEPATGMCPKGKLCCVLELKVSGQCGGTDLLEAPAQEGAANVGEV
uniref:Beta-defensin n=1 Tax=Peromyscus maniculatus bairdii TaxID=230844 RepID=A0A8C8UCM8_PERMB